MFQSKHFFLQAHAVSNQGKVRSNNEDNFFADGQCNPDPQKGGNVTVEKVKLRSHVFAVCDGMGGESYGEVASEIGVKTLLEHYPELKKARGEKLEQAVNQYATAVNNRICKMIAERKCGNSGTTLAMLCFQESYAYPFYIGDSRIYLYDGFDLYALTKDQTLANEMLLQDVYTPEQAEMSYDRNKLIHFMGEDKSRKGLRATAQEAIPLKRGMRFLLCSDGLSDMCSDLTLYEILSEPELNHAQALVDLALEAGGTDNVTVIVIDIL
ncbi:MAG: serine/threonine-protein phosphatase [Ruminococcus sp.]|nr:serine/threonine-protein phosphatase [Ruminococcus sp.]